MPSIDRRTAVTTCPRTRLCADRVTQMLRDREMDVCVFESDGAGYESAIRTGAISSAIDISLADLAAELLQTGFGAGPDRLTAAAMVRIPSLIVLGGLDAAEIADERAMGRTPIEYGGRYFVRTTLSECDRLGQEIAFKASAAEATTAVLIPCGGLSILDVPAGPHWHPGADRALVQSIRNWMSPAVPVYESPHSICDSEFAQQIVESFLRFAPARIGKHGRIEKE